MLAIIFIVLSLLWLCLAVFCIKEYHGDDEIVTFGIVIFLLVLTLNFVALYGHMKDIVTVRNEQIILTPTQEAIKDIEKDLKTIPNLPQIVNADSPAAALIAARSTAITALTEKRQEIADAKLSIERRKIGPSAWAVWILGDK